jgi:hypothetical protein
LCIEVFLQEGMMLRSLRGVVLAVSVAAATAPGVQGQAWSDRLFDSTTHDFKYVARGVIARHSFRITNRLAQRLHIASVQPSCPVCSVAQPSKQWLEPGESTTIDAAINTLSFAGPRSVSVTVTFDYPQLDQARLTLVCFSRSDVVLNPGEIYFGTVQRGTAASRDLSLEYAGSTTWKIERATCGNPDIQVELSESRREPGRVGYRLAVSLRPEAAPGAIVDRISLEVNDAYNKTIEIPLQAMVVGDVTLSQRTLQFGSVAPGAASKQVVIRGVRPFRIVKVEGGNAPFSIEVPDATRQTHFLKVTCKPDRPGELAGDFLIYTDIDSNPLKLHVAATAK